MRVAEPICDLTVFAFCALQTPRGPGHYLTPVRSQLKTPRALSLKAAMRSMGQSEYFIELGTVC